MAAEGIDPRGATIEDSPRPVVARTGRGLPNWVIAAGVLVAGIILFLILDGRRRQLSAPTTSARGADRRAGGEPPGLYVPPLPQPTPPPVIVPPPPPPAPSQPKIVYVPAPPPPQPPVTPPPVAPRNSADPVLVLDTTAGEGGATGVGVATGDNAAPGSAGAAGSVAGGSTFGSRSRASVLRNRSTTVPQGTLIPAVLETALDSTRPGPARALVTRDVRGFDGTKVLIPRGSRLIGEYKADLQPGQNRALVIWTRLVRPDGATIDLGSPSADPLGRVGIKGKVNSHFLERFANALLQTTLGVGAGLAAGLGGSNNNVAVLALPGATSTAGSSLVGSEEIKRTLRVKQGVSVSVFVARDLDFTSVESKK